MQLAKLAVMGMVMLTASGCGSLHLYDKAADETATAAQADYAASDVPNVLKAERAMLLALEQKEIEAFRAITLATRDTELLSLISTADNSFTTRFQQTVSDRLTVLAGTPDAALPQLRAYTEAKLARDQAAQREANIRLQVSTFPGMTDLPPCAAAIATTPALQGSAAQLIDPCKKLLAAEQRLAEAAANAGRLGTQQAAVDDSRRTWNRRQQQVQQAGTAFKAAAASLSTIELAKEEAKLAALGDAGVRVLAREKLERIRRIIAAMNGQIDPQLEPALAVLGASTRFSSALADYRAAGTLPPLEPLLIEQQLTAVQLAYADAGARLEESRVTMGEDMVQAIRLEIDLLLQARAALGGAGKAPATHSIEELLNKPNATKSGGSLPRAAFRALALLSESHSVARDRQQTLELKMISTQYQDALLRSESALSAWDAVIATPLEQLKTYHAGGVKTDEISNLLQAVGILGVAARVK